MNGKTLTHDRDNKKFTLLINGKTSGWKYDKDDKIVEVFYGAKKASETFEHTESGGSSVFITAKKSTRFTKSTDISGSNMCTGFQRISGAYYDSAYDSDGNTSNIATDEKKVQNTLLYIDQGKIKVYIMGDLNVTDDNSTTDVNESVPTRKCLKKVTKDDFNFKLDNVYLSKKVYKHTNAGVELEYFYKNESTAETVSCIVNADGDLIKIVYKGDGKATQTADGKATLGATHDANVSFSGTMTIVNDDYALTMKTPSVVYVDVNTTYPLLYKNIEKSLCKQ
jgi:hypothetical protein